MTTKKHRKEYEVLAHNPASAGRTSIDIKCPWCQSTFVAYVRSLAGSGKKCPNCSAHHFYRDNTALEPGRKLFD